MPVGKKLVVAATVLATGAGAALFFRKDASQVPGGQGAEVQSPFRERVERRVAADVDWARNARAAPAMRVATAATAAIAPPEDAANNEPTFQKSLNPVGALLEPIESATADDIADAARDDGEAGSDFAPLTSPLAHKIVDGDTLSKLAERYLGRGERYLDIFNLNRDVLSSPDLLPIGVVLKIPPREVRPSGADNRGAPASQSSIDSPLELVPVDRGTSG